MGQPRPIVIAELSGANFVLIDAPQRRKHAHRQLLARHFHTEHRNRQRFFDRRVLRYVDRKSGLTHRRAPGHDNKIGCLQSGSHRIDFVKPGGDASDRVVTLKQLIDAIERVDQEILDATKSAFPARFSFGDLKDHSFSVVQQLIGRAALGTISAIGNVGTGTHQGPQNRTFAYDVCVGGYVGGRRCVFRQLSQIGQPADRLEQFIFLQPLGQSDHIIWFCIVGQRVDGAEYFAVVATVEVALGESFDDLQPCFIVEHQPAEHRLLGFDGVGRNLERICDRITPGAGKRRVFGNHATGARSF